MSCHVNSYVMFYIFRLLLILIVVGVVVIVLLIVVLLKRWKDGVADDEEQEIPPMRLEENTVYLQHLEMQMIRRNREEAEFAATATAAAVENHYELTD